MGGCMSCFKEKIKEFNKEQQQAILTEENTVVSAGAGAGKTKTLATRFLYLITEKKLDVSSILCLTFTTKATTEMYSRIYTELKKNEENQYAKKAIENFQMARISTLDSVCNSIARYASRSYSITPDFSIDQKASIRLAEDVAMSFFLRNVKNPAVQKLVSYNSIENVISKLFVPFLTNYANITIPTDFESLLERQEKIIRSEYTKSVAQLKDIIEAIEAIVENASEEIYSKPAIVEARSIFEVASFDLPLQLSNKVDGEEYKDSLTIALRLMNLSLSNPGKQEELKAFNEKIKELREAFNTFNSLCNYDVMFVRDVFKLLQELEREYVEAKKRLGVLNYNDVANIALDSLKNDIGLRTYYKQSISSIMIDEFQDNNQVQRDILFLLAEKKDRTLKTIPTSCELEKGKLFFVGDEKQSIYAFRGADVSVFRRLMQDLNEQIKLETNYRTEKELIDIFNVIFPYVFYSAQHNGPSGEIPSFEAVFDDLQHFQETLGINSGLEVLLVDEVDAESKSEYLSSEEVEAMAVANRIKELYETEFKVRDKQSGKERACKWGDFVILLRTKTKQHNYEKQLKIAGVPYTATTQKWMFSYAPLNDLYAVLRLAVYPRDRKTYAQVLKSPFVSLSDEAFISVMLASISSNEEEKKDLQIPFALKMDEILQKEGLDDDLLAFRRGREIFDEVREALKIKTNAEIVQLLWYKWGYRYLLLSNSSYHEFLNLYDYLFFMASEADASHLDMSEFVDELHAYIENEEDIEDMDIPTSQKKDTVKIMTVHASKGLEFPIVIIPDAHNVGRAFKKEDIVFSSDKIGLSIHTPDVFSSHKNTLLRTSIIKESVAENTRGTFFFEDAREEENQKLHAELKRLFYVAMTRAEVKVIVSAVLKNVAKSTESVQKISFKKFINATNLPRTKNCFFNLLVYSLHLAYFMGEECEALNMEFYTVPLIKRFNGKNRSNINFMASRFANVKGGKIDLAECAALARSGAFQVKEYEMSKSPIIATAKLSIDEKKDRVFLFESKNEKLIAAIETGEASHAYLQAVLNGDERFDLASFHLSEKTMAEIEQYKENFLNSKYGKMAVEAKVKKTEYGFITHYDDGRGEKLTRGVIDLFFEWEDTVYIIDYKTDAKQSNNYDKQLSVYKKAVSDLYKSMYPDKTFKIKAYIFYLRNSLVVEVE